MQEQQQNIFFVVWPGNTKEKAHLKVKIVKKKLQQKEQK